MAAIRLNNIIACLMLTLFISSTTYAAIYKSIDKNGNTVFTDDPIPGTTIEPVQLKQPTIIPAQKTISPLPRQEIAKPQNIKYTSLKFTSPVNDSSIRNNDGIMLSASLQPDLHSEHRIQWKLDGDLLGQSGRNLNYLLNDVNRGTHQATIEVIDQSGKVLKSGSVTFHYQRTSVLNQTEPAPPTGTPRAPQAPKAPQVPKPPRSL